MPLSESQRLGLRQLRDIERESEARIELRATPADVTDLGWLVIELSIDCKRMQRTETGLRLRDRERITVCVPPDFPFRPPTAQTHHTRFDAWPHVQWRRHLCLYVSPETEWDASDGMFGFVTRLIEWLEQAAQNELDPTGAPLHPPVAYPADEAGVLVVPRANTPTVLGGPWIGLGQLVQVHASRVDVVEWLKLGDERAAAPLAAAVLLADPMPFEYPAKASALLALLEARGVPRDLLFALLELVATRNPDGAPLYAIVGTPMRGVRGAASHAQHLAAWRIDPTVADALRAALHRFSSEDKLREIGERLELLIHQWADQVDLAWCEVREARSEVTVRRDKDTPLSYFRGRTVSIWGSGALGGCISELLARAGVRRMILRDHRRVAPGVLVRQSFDEADIGLMKADVTAGRVRGIDPTIDVISVHEDLLGHLSGADWTDGADVVIDASASRQVLDKLEFRRAQSLTRTAPAVSLSVDHLAQRGLVVLAGARYSGGPGDVVRRTKLQVCRRAELGHFADAFWPTEPAPVFQPEPGCSANTFIGSAADLVGLAAAMVNLAAVDLARGTDAEATAHLVTQPHVSPPPGAPQHASFNWRPDVALVDPETNYEIRIAHEAWAEMLGWVERSERTLGEEVETGGVLFGEIDDAVRVVYVSEAIGPPPDSESSAHGFVCGVEGVKGAEAEKLARSRGSVRFLGMWHTHPDQAPLPSDTDFDGMARILMAAGTRPSKALLVILGTASEGPPALGTFLFTTSDLADAVAGPRIRFCAVQWSPGAPPRKRIALALSGGGARAIAFHLGCLRALHDRGILDQVDVISAVSGGSVLGALYAYGAEDFEAIDRQVEALLRRGLVGSILRRALLSRNATGAMVTAATAGVLAVLSDLIRPGARAIADFAGRDKGYSHWTDRIQPPLRRAVSRSTAFEAALGEALGDLRLSSPTRRGLDVVINATELSTGSAFRFGNRESGCWRFGVLQDEVSVAFAVAASAAYPAFLPAFDRVLRFRRPDGTTSSNRVLLTDGGVYDNLGTGCLEPGRSIEVSQHVRETDYIIICDAGVGLPSGHEYPYWWPSRMHSAFEAIFRRVQNTTRNRLHQYSKAGTIRGFVLAYLGQQDSKLPWAPPDLVKRESVACYPTDFAPMTSEYITRLSRRGEQLTRLLIDRYCPEL